MEMNIDQRIYSADISILFDEPTYIVEGEKWEKVDYKFTGFAQMVKTYKRGLTYQFVD